jgi:hypothetical protein
MRGIIQDQVSNIFIEGPIQPKPMGDSSLEGNHEKAAYHADLTQGFEVNDDPNFYDMDKPYYPMNDRYD